MKKDLRLFFYSFLCLTIFAYIVFLSANGAYAASSVKWEKNYDKAVNFLKNKKYDSALEYANKAVKENKNPYTYELEANILQFKKRYNLSTDYYKRSIIAVLKTKNFKNPNKFLSSLKNGTALNYLLTGNNFLKKRRINDAIKQYKKGLSYASEKKLVNFLTLNLAMSYENSAPAHLKKAIYYSNKIIKNNPKNYYAFFLKGRAEYGLKEFNSSLEDFTTARKLNPGNKMIIEAINVDKKAISYRKNRDIRNIKKSTGNLFK
jgi:tetratricopeptide (TPR) repeat protein